MSSLRRKLVSALVAAVSVGGFSGSVSNIACASSTDNVETLLGDLIDRLKEAGGYDRSRSIMMLDGRNWVIPCFNDGYVQFDLENAGQIELRYGKSLGQVLDDYFITYNPLKKYNNKPVYGAGSKFMPWLREKYIYKFTTVSSVAMWVLKESESVSEIDGEKGVESLKSFVGDDTFESCKRRWDSCYNLGAVCFVLYNLVKEFNEYCDVLNSVVDRTFPLENNKFNVGVLSKSEDKTDFFDSLLGGKNIVYDCVVRLAKAVLELFTR